MSIDNPSVNRCLKDKAFDHIDHALGRPIFPLRESHRNYFATDADSDLAKSFAQSRFWAKTGQDKRMTFFHVTDAGRQALADHLAVHDRQHAFVVTWDGHSQTIAARTASKAKYDYFLHVQDVMPDLRFIDFSRDARVRRAA